MLGHKDEDDERLPRVVESLLGRDITMAACGVAHTMALGGEHISLPGPSSHYLLISLSGRRGVLMGLRILWPPWTWKSTRSFLTSNDRGPP